jgi:hypothetical protein
LRGRFIPAKACFELEVAGHGVDHRRRHQRRAGIVEVDQLRDSGVSARSCSMFKARTP